MTLIHFASVAQVIALATFLMPSAASGVEVILDNTDGAGVDVVGSWVSAQDVRGSLSADAEMRNERQKFASQHFGVEFIHDRHAGKGQKSVTFRPALPAAGTYEVFVWWPSGPDRATEVPVVIGSAEGERRVRINQREKGGQWNAIATVRIREPRQAWLRIETVGAADGRVVADAVKYVLRGDRGAFPPAPPTSEPVLRFGSQPQLLVDDHVVSQKTNVRRVLARAVKVNGGKPILTAEKPWEDAGSFGIWATAMYDAEERLFKLWYWPRRHFHAYATSKDGVHWDKPNLGLREWQGSKENNLFETGQRAEDFGRHFIVYKDPHEVDPNHRYKAVGDAAKYSQCRLLYSADGLRWNYYNESKPVTYRAADFSNHVLWDPAHHAYLLFTRPDYGATGGRDEIRGVRTMINPDLKGDPEGWRTLKSWLLDRPGDLPHRRQVYVLIDQIHEGVHVGLLLVYEHLFDLSESTEPDYHKRHERDVLNLYLATSRNGADWDTHWVYEGQPLIERGPDGSFDKDGVPPISIVTHGDEHFIYYGGWDERHEMTVQRGNHRGIGLAKLPRDRFAGLTAESAGSFTTKPFVFAGSRLLLNASAGQGDVKIEVLDESGSPIAALADANAGSVSRTDGIRITPTWKSPEALSQLQGRTVRLRFQLRNASIYAFRVQ